jgi:NADH-quinone oxidoreductase subunit E
MNAFLSRHTQAVNEILARYPADQKRSAVMPLLHLAQSEAGYVNRQAVTDIAAICEINPTEVASVVGFYTLYHDHPEGRYRFQICTDLPCALRGADTFLHDLCRALKIKPGQTTSDGLITVEEVKCLAACHRAPMFQVQSAAGIEYHENQTVDTAMQLVADLRKKEAA